MGIFTFNARVHALMYQKSNIEYRLMKLTKKLQSLQQYSALIANGGIQIGDLLSSPGVNMGRTMNYLAWAHNNSLLYMQQNAPQAIQWYQSQMGRTQSPENNAMMQNWIMLQFYQQGRDRAMQIETRNLKVEEDKIAQEKERLEAQGKSVEAELKAAKEGRDQAIKDMAPKYTFQA